MVKQESSSAGFFYSALVPYEHFIPVRSDFTDLISQLEWAQAHDAQARTIAKNARGFARSHLRAIGVSCFIAALLDASNPLLLLRLRQPLPLLLDLSFDLLANRLLQSIRS